MRRVLAIALLGSVALLVAAGRGKGAPTTEELRARPTTYETLRERWRLERPLSVGGAAGEETLPTGTFVTQTRKLNSGNGSFAYVVNDDASVFGFVRADELEASATKALVATASSPWLRALNRILAGQSKRGRTRAYEENAGARQLASSRSVPDAIAITIDLCPSHRRFEDDLFSTLAAIGKARGKAIPVTAFVSGNWLRGRHERRIKEIARLQRYAEAGTLAITFANHSSTHPYSFGKRSFDRDFLLSPGTDLRREILDTELAVIGAGFTPAPFFRFPGLISTATLQREVRDSYSLIDIGAGSWPGLGQEIKPGDVVLVHGNGGEPDGVRRLLTWLKARHAELMSGALNVAPLADIIGDKDER